MDIGKIIYLIKMSIDMDLDVLHDGDAFIIRNCNEVLSECDDFGHFETWLYGYQACYKQLRGED